MFTKTQLENFLFFDVETAGSVSEYDKLTEPMQALWSHRCEYLRSLDKHPENSKMSDSELFLQKSALQAEFGRVVCVSLGRVKFSLEDFAPPSVQIVSYSGVDEYQVLTSVFKVMNAMTKKGMKLFGHNVKRFDVPYLCKRAFINSLEPPVPLQVWDKKPWEIGITDSSELWSFGAWQEGFTSLELLCTVLGLASPKDEMRGDEVHRNFYEGKIEDIKKYCQKDVISTIRVAFCLSGLNQFDDSDITVK